MRSVRLWLLCMTNRYREQVRSYKKAVSPEFEE